MTTPTRDSANRLIPGEVRLDRLLGRQMHGMNNRPIGRIEEFRGRKHGNGCSIAEYVIGPAGLFERLDLAARLLAGGRRRGYVARWDQVDLTDPDRPRLTCPLEDLERL
jgi:hypothetical protein